MSVVVALKYKDGVVIASDRQASYGNLKVDNCRKTFKSEYSNTAYGITGSTRDIDIVSCNIIDLMNHRDILEGTEFDKKYIVNNVVNNVFDLLKNINYSYKDINEIESHFIFVSSNRIFEMFNNGAILEHDFFCCIGSGGQLAKGLLDSKDRVDYKVISREEAVELAHSAIRSSCKDDIYIDGNIDMYILENKEVLNE